MEQVHQPSRQPAPITLTVRMREADQAARLAAELDGLNRLVTSEPGPARALAEDLQFRAEILGERQILAGALLCQAEGSRRSGELAATVALIDRATDVGVPLSPENLVRASLLRSFVHSDLGDDATAMQHVMDAVGAFTDEVPRGLRIRVQNRAADLLHRLGALDEALLWYARAEELAVGDPQTHVMVANNRAYAALIDGRVDDARAGVRQLFDLSARYGYPLDVAVLDTVARIHLLAGEPVQAAAIAQQIVRATHQVNFLTPDATPYYLHTLAVAQRSLGDLHAAQATLVKAEEACKAEGCARVRSEILKEQSEVQAALGDFEGAYTLFKAFHAADKELVSQERAAQARIRQLVFETTTARKEAARYREEARRDPLTGLYNRLHVRERLDALLNDAPLRHAELSVALIDLDHFKAVNDRYSHEAGDRVLQAVAQLLETVVPVDGASFAARFGGEEFLLVLLTPDRAQAHTVVELARRTVEQHSWHSLTPGRGITLSAGLAAKSPGDTYDTLLARADRQLYVAKTRGRNRISVDG